MRRAALACWLALGAVAGCNGQNSITPRGSAGEEDEELYAIRCVTMIGAERFRQAATAEKLLKNVSGLRPELVLVRHLEDESNVYYGRYQRLHDAASGRESFRPDFRRDLKLIRTLSLTVTDRNLGQRVEWPFLQATVESLPSSHQGNPAWDLARADGYWSWQVAVFVNEGEMRRRKAVAEEYTRQLRDQGEQAFYHHGAVYSSVCIGLFPKSSVQTVESRDPLTGRVTTVNRIVDPRMLDLARRYPHNLHNGRVRYTVVRDKATGKIDRREPRDASFPVILPAAQHAGGLGL
jgi:hypothetical protein